MNPKNTALFEQIVSKPRLGSYRAYFKVSHGEAIGLYMWNCELSVNFGVLWGFLEIALRNSTHRVLSQFTSGGASASSAWYDAMYAKLSKSTKSKIDFEKTDKNGLPLVPPPTPDELVSRLSFGFWPNLLNGLDKSYTDITLAGIFPHHPLNANVADWKTKANVKKALAPLFELNDFRNRLAHHESLWKFPPLFDTSTNPATILLPKSNSMNDSIVRLKRVLGLYDDVIKSLNHDLYLELSESSWRRKIDFLLSSRGAIRYRHEKHTVASSSMTPAELKRKFREVSKENQPVRVRKAKQSGVFIPD
jgi:hypothetical protein